VQSGTLSSDRFVAGQVEILRSVSLAQIVATSVGSPADADVISQALAVTSSLGSDAVTIEVSAPTPERAQQLAAGYVTSYLDKLEADERNYSDTATTQLDSQIASITGQLAALDTQIVAIMAPYLPSTAAATGRFDIPSVDQIAPGLATQRAQLVSQTNELTTRRTELQIQQLNGITSSVIQPATLPSAAFAKSTLLFGVAGLFAGAFFGILAAVVIARLSPRVLDAEHAEEVLGTPVLDGLPRIQLQAMGDATPMLFAPRPMAGFVDRLCVQAEGWPRNRNALTVAVVGTQRDSGATTIAGAMAERFAAYGTSVLLMDANPRHPDLTERFHVEGPGLSSLWNHPRRGAVGVPAHVDNLSFVGLANLQDAAALRRNDVRDLLDLASHDADVVIIDAGALREVASALRLALAADVVVLTVPVGREHADNLRWISSKLRDHADHLLPVSVPLRRRSWLARSAIGSRRTASEPNRRDLEPDDEPTLPGRKGSENSPRVDKSSPDRSNEPRGGTVGNSSDSGGDVVRTTARLK
jgi:Mrp family chromosome partitioning ATPase